MSHIIKVKKFTLLINKKLPLIQLLINKLNSKRNGPN